MEVANTLDYNTMATTTGVKSFTVQVYGQASNNSHIIKWENTTKFTLLSNKVESTLMTQCNKTFNVLKILKKLECLSR